jgi:hypothetical protein
MDFELDRTMPVANSARPSSSGVSRQALGAAGVTLRATPSGEMRTRRSESSAATAAAAGTPASTTR